MGSADLMIRQLRVLAICKFIRFCVFLAAYMHSIQLVLANEIHIDGVIVAVSDANTATKAYTKMGFTVKPGRMHKNGLLNAHIKLPNKTSIELMSLVSKPTDDISRKYRNILKEGESGAYLTLSGSGAAEFSKKIDGIEHEKIRGRFWDYVIFPEGSGLEHIFLFHPHSEFKSEQRFYIHGNGAKKIDRVWIEGSDKVKDLFIALNFRYCGRVTHELRLTGELFRTSQGDIVVTKKTANGRPKILGVSIEMESKTPILIGNNEANGIWIDNQKRRAECEADLN